MDAASEMSNNNVQNVTNAPGSYEQILKSFTKFIISSGSLTKCDFESFAEIIEHFNPDAAKRITQKNVVKVAKNEYVTLKQDLHSTFASLSHKVALACDVWRNEGGCHGFIPSQHFIRITVHWIDSDWTMHRRIIKFEMLDYPIYAENVSELVKNSVNEWEITDKIFSVTLDDVCDIDDSVEDLKSVLHPVLDGKMFRFRCACRALNSCILDGLTSVSLHLNKIRDVAALPNEHPERFFKSCVKYGLEPKFATYYNEAGWYGVEPKFIMFDDEARWDSTRTMLKSCLQFKDIVVDFVASNWSDDESFAISEQDWEVVSVYCRFLDVFYEAVDYVSSNYYPSSSAFLLHLVNIAKLFSEYKGSAFQEKISVMEERFLKHFDRIPNLYCLAAIMDPRVKLSGCECLLESFYHCTENTNVNVEKEKMEVSNLLREMFNLYASQSSKRQQPSSCEPSYAWSVVSQKKEREADSAIDELTLYLQAPNQYNEHEAKDFDILEWWKSHEVIYPVLSSMARDLLTTPLSTLAPDCAFLVNEGKRITDESYHYSDRTLNVYTCLKDWFNAEFRTQGKGEPPDDDECSFVFEDHAITNKHLRRMLEEGPITNLPRTLKRPRTHFPSFSH